MWMHRVQTPGYTQEQEGLCPKKSLHRCLDSPFIMDGVWRKKEQPMIQSTPCVKHGGGRVSARANMCAKGSGLLVCTDDLTVDSSSRVKCTGLQSQLQNCLGSTLQCKQISRGNRIVFNVQQCVLSGSTKLNAETHKQATTEGGWIKGSNEHLWGGNIRFGDIQGF